MAIQPIFILSLPRSGSTLTQRVIAAHQGVATASEPWLLLPYLYTLRERGWLAEYAHRETVQAVEDFCKQLPAGVDDYYQEMRTFVLRLYEKAAGDGARFFIDKSPPYYLVAAEIMRMFPDGKFIFLWRNPLSVVASIIETFYNGKFYVTRNRENLFLGLPRLVATYLANPSRAYAVRYEDLVEGGQFHWEQLMQYLDLEFDPKALERFSEVRLQGRLGDSVGTARYTALSAEPTVKWQRTLSNPLRKEWCRRWLRFLGAERLSVMGYDQAKLLEELDAQATGTEGLAGDLVRLLNDVAREPIRHRNRRLGLGGPSALRPLL